MLFHETCCFFAVAGKLFPGLVFDGFDAANLFDAGDLASSSLENSQLAWKENYINPYS